MGSLQSRYLAQITENGWVEALKLLVDKGYRVPTFPLVER